jgi:adenylate kinase family enzyme
VETYRELSIPCAIDRMQMEFHGIFHRNFQSKSGLDPQPMAVPKRILILGPSGAGKSALARRVGERLGLPIAHLDAIYWNPGWVPTEIGQFRERVAHLAARDTWVMDGNYTTHLDLRLPRAEAVIWLDLPRYVYFPRAVWRMIRNYWRERGDVGPGCPERFELSFFRDWVWTYPTCSRARHAELMANLPAGTRRIILRTLGEVAKFTNDLPRSLDSSSGVQRH